MRKIKIVLVVLFFGGSISAQNYKADTLRVDDLTSRASEFRNYNKIRAFEMDNGFVITEGTEIKIGTPAVSRMEFQSLMRGNITTAALLGSDGANLHRNFAGTKYVIRKVFVTHSAFSRESPLRVGINVGSLEGSGAAASASDIMASIDIGELEIVGMLTKEQAIKQMLEAKELFDAGFLTEEEFEAKKVELKKYVKQATGK